MSQPVRLLSAVVALATLACDRSNCTCCTLESADSTGPLAWRWVDSPARLLDCVEDYHGPLQLDVVRRQGDGWHVRFLEKNRELHARDWPVYLAFRVEGDVLYFPEYERVASGCALVAYDLKAGKQLWRTGLRGLGPVQHDRYVNEVDLTVVDGVVTVYGRESSGRYVERVDAKTGRTLEHKTFPAGG